MLNVDCLLLAMVDCSASCSCMQRRNKKTKLIILMAKIKHSPKELHTPNHAPNLMIRFHLPLYPFFPLLSSVKGSKARKIWRRLEENRTHRVVKVQLPFSFYCRTRDWISGLPQPSFSALIILKPTLNHFFYLVLFHHSMHTSLLQVFLSFNNLYCLQ